MRFSRPKEQQRSCFQEILYFRKFCLNLMIVGAILTSFLLFTKISSLGERILESSSSDDERIFSIPISETSRDHVNLRRESIYERDTHKSVFEELSETSEDVSLSSLPPTSLLNSANMADIPPCPAARLSLKSKDDYKGTTSENFSEENPAIFSGWKPPALKKWSNNVMFEKDFGGYAQYVKGRDVQPLRDSFGNRCVVTTRMLMRSMAHIFKKRIPETDNISFRANRFDEKPQNDLLFFTNDIENPSFLEALSSDYSTPSPISEIESFADGFKVFSAMERGSSHPFHFHDVAWLGQVSGSRLWYFLPPGTARRNVGPKVNGCDYLLGLANLPNGASACIQNPGEIMYLPPLWFHATCALEPWSIGIGGQGGNPKHYMQNFGKPKLDSTLDVESKAFELMEREKMIDCGVLEDGDLNDLTSNIHSQRLEHPTDSAFTDKELNAGKNIVEVQNEGNQKDNWKWYDGDINEYYNKLERDEHARRNPNKITSYAVHRWMGPNHSTLIHYQLVREVIYELLIGSYAPSFESSVSDSGVPGSGNSQFLRIFDAGCGLGAGLMWFERNEPQWELVGNTLSEEQYKWIVDDLPDHKFKVRLRTYDEPLEETDAKNVSALKFNAIYSIEAAIHSPNLQYSLSAWSDALEPEGVIVIIDDFLSLGVPSDDPDVKLFVHSWIANSVHSTTEIAAMAEQVGMTLVRDRDLGSEFQVIKRNYRNRVPELKDEHGRMHQGWLGSKVRQKLMVEGKISYRLIALKKKGTENVKAVKHMKHPNSCMAVPVVTGINGPSSTNQTLSIKIDPVLKTGRGNTGGHQMACISSWYCCDKGTQFWDDLESNRTERTGYLQLPRELFGHYLESFSKHLTDFYRSYPSDYLVGSSQGIFLDIGGTGSVASGMTQVTSKFAHFSGPLKYWVLDSDPSAKKLSNAIVCDIDSCEEAPDCAYDVTFSHTVLEHAARPWKSFDTIARITKKGGLTLHLVPWSYQYHATPDDNYRFSHKALTTLLEDRGFEVLDIGYDVCTQPEKMKAERKDEHFDTIWLTYIVGKKL